MFTDPSDVCKWGRAVRSCVEKWQLCIQCQHPFMEDQVIPRAATKASALCPMPRAGQFYYINLKMEIIYSYLFVLFVCFLVMSCRILSPGIKPLLPAMEVWSPNHCTARKVPSSIHIYLTHFGWSFPKHLYYKDLQHGALTTPLNSCLRA